MWFESHTDDNNIEATKNICCVKGEGTIDHSAVT